MAMKFILCLIALMHLSGCVSGEINSISVTPARGDWQRPDRGQEVVACTDTNQLRRYHLEGLASQWCKILLVNNAVPTHMVLHQMYDSRRIYHIRPTGGRECFFVNDELFG
jgi:hypothetical protein